MVVLVAQPSSMSEAASLVSPSYAVCDPLVALLGCRVMLRWADRYGGLVRFRLANQVSNGYLEAGAWKVGGC